MMSPERKKQILEKIACAAACTRAAQKNGQLLRSKEFEKELDKLLKLYFHAEPIQPKQTDLFQ